MNYGIFLIYAVVSGFTAIWVKFAQKSYIQKLAHSMVFCFWYALFQMLIFMALPPYGGYHLNGKIALFTFCFAILGLSSQIFMLNALKNGPVSLTNIIMRYHVIIPTLLGIYLWRESLSGFQLGGLILFGVSTVLFNRDSRHGGDEKKAVSVRWLTATLSATLLTGIAVIFTKEYMRSAVGPIREYLILFNLFTMVFCALNLAVQWIRGTAPAKPAPRFFGYTFLAALTMNAANYIYMEYVTKFSSAFFFPALGLINLLAVLLLSMLIFKEKLGRPALVGVFISFIAIFLLSLG